MQKHDCSKDDAYNPELVFTQRPETIMKVLWCSCCRGAAVAAAAVAALRLLSLRLLSWCSCCRGETAVSVLADQTQHLPECPMHPVGEAAAPGSRTVALTTLTFNVRCTLVCWNLPGVNPARRCVYLDRTRCLKG